MGHVLVGVSVPLCMMSLKVVLRSPSTEILEGTPHTLDKIMRATMALNDNARYGLGVTRAYSLKKRKHFLLLQEINSKLIRPRRDSVNAIGTPNYIR